MFVQYMYLWEGMMDRRGWTGLKLRIRDIPALTMSGQVEMGKGKQGKQKTHQS
jgi:hypothetical protein